LDYSLLVTVLRALMTWSGPSWGENEKRATEYSFLYKLCPNLKYKIF
jgi:hypothetical protein